MFAMRTRGDEELGADTLGLLRGFGESPGSTPEKSREELRRASSVPRWLRCSTARHLAAPLVALVTIALVAALGLQRQRRPSLDQVQDGVAVSMLASSAPRTGKCSVAGDNCWASKCCSDPGETCYVKDLRWATCMKNCSAGVHEDEPKALQTPWSCARIAHGAAAMPPGFPVPTTRGANCSGEGENCLNTLCCKDPESKCYEKNSGWAMCKKSCTPGIDKFDPEWAQTPWSCELAPSGRCAVDAENCIFSKCCNDPAMQCYAKDNGWGECLRSCKPGIHARESKRLRTPWRCSGVVNDAEAVRGRKPEVAAPLACADDRENCLGSMCCKDKSKKCFEKNPGWGVCRKTCEPGIDLREPREFQTPWSCKEAPSGQCSQSWENCAFSKCCSTPGMKCFEKDQGWAQCKKTCSQGIDFNEPEELHSPWSCRVLGASTLKTCSAFGTNCSSSKCCSGFGMKCFQKDAGWAECKKSCVEGINQRELKEYQTPWNCRELKSEEGEHHKPVEAEHGCAKYGCSDYHPLHACQCNEVCKYFHNCCPDYAGVCEARKGPRANTTRANATAKAKLTLRTTAARKTTTEAATAAATTASTTSAAATTTTATTTETATTTAAATTTTITTTRPSTTTTRPSTTSASTTLASTTTRTSSDTTTPATTPTSTSTAPATTTPASTTTPAASEAPTSTAAAATATTAKPARESAPTTPTPRASASTTVPATSATPATSAAPTTSVAAATTAESETSSAPAAAKPTTTSAATRTARNTNRSGHADRATQAEERRGASEGGGDATKEAAEKTSEEGADHKVSRSWNQYAAAKSSAENDRRHDDEADTGKAAAKEGSAEREDKHGDEAGKAAAKEGSAEKEDKHGDEAGEAAVKEGSAEKEDKHGDEADEAAEKEGSAEKEDTHGDEADEAAEKEGSAEKEDKHGGEADEAVVKEGSAEKEDKHGGEADEAAAKEGSVAKEDNHDDAADSPEAATKDGSAEKEEKHGDEADEAAAKEDSAEKEDKHGDEADEAAAKKGSAAREDKHDAEVAVREGSAEKEDKHGDEADKASAHHRKKSDEGDDTVSADVKEY